MSSGVCVGGVWGMGCRGRCIVSKSGVCGSGLWGMGCRRRCIVGSSGICAGGVWRMGCRGQCIVSNNNNLITYRALFTCTDQQRFTTILKLY